MTPLDFLQAVWPSEGHYCLALPFASRDGGQAYQHKVFPTIEAAAAVAGQVAKLKDVFFCVHTLTEPFVWDANKLDYKTGLPGAKAVRVQTNTFAAKAFFFDLDVGTGDKKYPSQAAALAGLIQFCKDAQLAKPMITSSGGGLHVYWLLSEALPSAEWRNHAAKLKALAKHHGLLADPARTTDTSSVLRVAGTFNLKDPTNPRAVELLAQGKPTGTGAFIKMIDDAVIRASLNIRVNPVYQQPTGHSVLGSQDEIEFDAPQVTMKAVLIACEQMRTIMATREDVDQTTWYHSINVTRFVDDGMLWSERISAKHRVERVAGKIAILEEKAIKPASCLTLADKCGDEACGRCPFAGKVKNPLMAARFKDEAPQPQVAEMAGFTTCVIDIPPPPKPYARLKSGGIAMTGKNADGEEQNTVIYPHDIYPVRRLVNSASATEQQMWRVVLPREGSKDFLLDADALYDRRKFSLTIANQGIYPHSANVPYLQDYMTAYIAELQKLTDAEAQCNHLGWTDDHSKFIMPDKIMLRDGTAKPAMLSVGAARASAQVHKVGTLQRQVELLRFYNHDAYLANQFMILAGLGAPIFYATGHHGVIINASGEAGASKSTTLYTAASLWGNPEMYPINGTNNGATVRGRNERVTTLANLPICVDEITHMAIKDAVDLAMGITQPGHRIRLDTSGTERGASGSHKATIMLTTANNSLHGLLSTDNTAGTAGSMRVFEIALKAGIVHKKREADAYLHELRQNYGHIAEVFLYHVMQNQPAIEARMRTIMAEVDEQAGIASSERFWSAAIACVIVTGEIAHKLGLLPYDIAKIKDWAIDRQIPFMRGIVREEYSSPMGILAEYLEHAHGNTVVVQKMTGHSALTTGVNVMRSPHGQMLAHYDMSEQTMWVLKKGFKDYCVRVGANFLKVLDELHTPKIDENGHVTKVIGNKHIRKTLGAGTDLAKAQSWCFTINMAHPDVSGAVDLSVIASSDAPTTPPTGKLKSL